MVNSMVAPVEAGARAFLAMAAMDHTKFVVVDRKWICVGSWNCWLRTHFYEAETNIVVEDPAMGARIVREEIDHVVRRELLDLGDVVRYNGKMLRREGAMVAAKLGHAGDAFSLKFIYTRAAGWARPCGGVEPVPYSRT